MPRISGPWLWVVGLKMGRNTDGVFLRSSSRGPPPWYVSLQHAWSDTGEVIDRTRYISMAMSPYGFGFGSHLGICSWTVSTPPSSAGRVARGDVVPVTLAGLSLSLLFLPLHVDWTLLYFVYYGICRYINSLQGTGKCRCQARSAGICVRETTSWCELKVQIRISAMYSI